MDAIERIGFQTLIEDMSPKDGGWLATIPVTWRQGRTAYGGLTLGLSFAAVEKTIPDLPPLRSAVINFIGPVTGDPVFKSRLLRKGRNVTSIEVIGRVAEDIISSVTFIFGATRESVLQQDFPASHAKAPEDCEPFTPEFARNFVPKFFHNFDTRLIDGARPVTGAKRGYIRTWSRHYDVASRMGVAAFLTLSDVLPPAAMPMLTQLGPISSVNFMFNVLVDNPTTSEGWWQVETALSAAQGGYSSQVMRFWNTDGVLVAEGMQSVAIFI